MQMQRFIIYILCCCETQTTYNAVEYAECFCHCHVAHTHVPCAFCVCVCVFRPLTLSVSPMVYFRSIFNLHFYIGRYFSIIFFLLLLLLSGHRSLLFESFKIIDRKLKCVSVAIVIVMNDFKRTELHLILCPWITLPLNDFSQMQFVFFFVFARIFHNLFTTIFNLLNYLRLI